MIGVAILAASEGVQGLTFEQWMIVAGVGVPALGGIAAVLAVFMSRRTGKEQVDVEERKTEVEERKTDVTEKQAHTAEIAMIIDGFTQSHNAAMAALANAQAELAVSRGELTHATEKLRVASEDLADARRDNDALRRRLVGYSHQLREMVLHIFALELLVPNPPGPPARPDWDLWPDEPTPDTTTT